MWAGGTYPYLCLPVIPGNITKHIGVLLQATIRKAGTIGTLSVPRTTASSTIGTVSGTGAGARHVTHSSSLSCIHLPSVVPPVFAVICHPSVFAVIPPSSLSCVVCPRRHLTPGRPALSGMSLLSALPAAVICLSSPSSVVCHPPTFAAICHPSCHPSPSLPHLSVRRCHRRWQNVRYSRCCCHWACLGAAIRPSPPPVNCPPMPPPANLLAAPAQNMLDIPDAAAAHPLINCT